MSKFENGLFIFRRDFRTIDNNGLNLLNDLCKNVFTIFVFTPEQATAQNKFKSNNAIQFMIESLEDLAADIDKKGGRLHTFYGHNDVVIADCIKQWNINIVGFNIDYTPYARTRDAEVVRLCERTQTFVIYDYDYYLLEPGEVLNGSGETYQKFTPYYNAALKKKVKEPSREKNTHFAKKSNTVITLGQAMNKFTRINPNISVRGGRENAKKVLREALRAQTRYSTTHNDLAKPTSMLSAYIKFGCLSIREVYSAFNGNRALIRQLYWRDFYANILLAYPRVLGHALKPNYDKIKWHYNARYLDAWKNGETGFPVVDACMTQLNTTGYLHNRGRLIVASFLVKTLLLDWREGERYFAQQLTDYDVASNNGNWLWIMGGGADSQPWFRIFNPWEQGRNFDPDCEYIKKWLPNLESFAPKIIHHWDTEYHNNKNVKYVKPICDYKEQKLLANKMYEGAFK
jgi:deoxyribodipyrimidine photo-lyase